MSATATIMAARVAAQQMLAEAKFKVRHPKDIKEFTDFDRQIMLDADVSEYMVDYETYRGLETLLGARLNALSSLLLQTPHGSKTIEL